MPAASVTWTVTAIKRTDEGPPTRRAGGPITGNPGGPITLAKKSAHTGPILLADDNRIGAPAVVGLAGELKHPARHCHGGDPVGGELTYERVDPFSRQVGLR